MIELHWGYMTVIVLVSFLMGMVVGSLLAMAQMASLLGSQYAKLAENLKHMKVPLPMDTET